MSRNAYAFSEKNIFLEMEGGRKKFIWNGETQDDHPKQGVYPCAAKNGRGLMGGLRPCEKGYPPHQPVFGTFYKQLKNRDRYIKEI